MYTSGSCILHSFSLRNDVRFQNIYIYIYIYMIKCNFKEIKKKSVVNW